MLGRRLYHGVGDSGSRSPKRLKEGGTWQRWKLHINILEIMTIVKALNVLEVRDQTLVICSDNQVPICVVLCLESHSPDLQGVTANLLERMLERNASLRPRHIRGKANVVSDALSRDCVIRTEWEFDEDTFRSLERLHDSCRPVFILA